MRSARSARSARYARGLSWVRPYRSGSVRSEPDWRGVHPGCDLLTQERSGVGRIGLNRPVSRGVTLLMRLGGNTLRGSNPRSSAGNQALPVGLLFAAAAFARALHDLREQRDVGLCDERRTAMAEQRACTSCPPHGDMWSAFDAAAGGSAFRVRRAGAAEPEAIVLVRGSPGPIPFYGLVHTPIGVKHPHETIWR